MKAGLKKVFKEIQKKLDKETARSEQSKRKIENRKKAYYYSKLLNKK